MGSCPRCGERTGLLRNRPVSCAVCGASYCWVCRQWDGVWMEGGREESSQLCSEGCALEFIKGHLGRLRRELGLVLINESNVTVALEEETKDSQDRHLAVWYCGVDPRKVQDDDRMVSEARSLYDKVRGELEERGLRFREDEQFTF